MYNLSPFRFFTILNRMVGDRTKPWRRVHRVLLLLNFSFEERWYYTTDELSDSLHEKEDVQDEVMHKE